MMIEQMVLDLPCRLRAGDELRAEYGGSARFKLAPRKTAEFWAKMTKPDGENGCWEWTHEKSLTGYGVCVISGRRWQSHRLAWCIANKRAVPAGLIMLHDCDNRLCCNPAHLHPGTSSENTKDAARRKRMAHGSRHGFAKLDEGKVRQIREMWAQGKLQTDIAEVFSVSRATIQKVLSGATWGWCK